MLGRRKRKRRPDAGLPDTSRRDPHKPGESPALQDRREKNRPEGRPLQEARGGWRGKLAATVRLESCRQRRIRRDGGNRRAARRSMSSSAIFRRSRAELRLLRNLGQGDLRLTQEGHRRMVCAKMESNSGNLVQISNDSRCSEPGPGEGVSTGD